MPEAAWSLPPLLLLSILIALGFYVGKMMRYLRLPAIIGYMIAGFAVGPHGFGTILGDHELGALSFINEIALGFVAFTIGTELRLKVLRQFGKGIVFIILVESLAAFLLVLLAVYLVSGDLPLALIFAAVAPASAPAGTVAVIQEYGAKGSLTSALYAVVGFDDGLAILIFGFAAAAARQLLQVEAGGPLDAGLAPLAGPALEIAASLAVGGMVGVLFSFLVRKLGNLREGLILVAAVVFACAGLAELAHLSLILTNLMVGFMFANTRDESLVHRLGDQISGVMPLVYILFFALAGAHLNPMVLRSLGLLGGAYVIARSAGLMGGAYLGALIGRVEDKIRKYLGLGILSQAGVAIGLALIVKAEITGLSEHAEQIGTVVITTVTATCVLFEIVGPILAKMGLARAGEIPEEEQPPAGR